MSDEDELASIVSGARALLAWEEAIGGGVPAVVLGARVAAQAAVAAGPVAAPAVAAAAPEAKSRTPSESATIPKVSERERVPRLAVLAAEAASCTRCRLGATRTKSVFARGNPGSPVVFVGEGPGFHEDQEGEPFVGPAGQLLDKMVVAMGFGRDDVYICNVVKCRPPENRTPLPDEAAACAPFLRGQIEAVAPKVIVALGKSAGVALGCFDAEARGWRGKWSSWEGVPVMPTFHPAYLLRSPEQKRPVWDDLKAVMARLKA